MNRAETAETILHPTMTQTGYVWFLRIIAGYCLLFGLFYWIRLIGMYDGAEWRFDTMPLHWQVAASTLAVLFPTTAIGLWLLSSWGAVLWFCCAATEAAMYVAMPDLFGFRPTLAFTHLAVATVYVAFRIALHLQARKAEKVR